MTIPGVGAIIALTFVSAIDDPARFSSSKQVGAHFGITPKKWESGETSYTGRISKIGDKEVRTALYQAAHIILTKPVRAAQLKRWGMAVAKRAGQQKAKVALARKLAVLMHRMLAPRSSLNSRRADTERVQLRQAEGETGAVETWAWIVARPSMLSCCQKAWRRHSLKDARWAPAPPVCDP